ncbi:MAG TPA: hypothetical protein VGU25_02135 [Acidobacteriaceae bacterium]|nr:hypothetical protein [Acidobacteriaceae bacterium]
MKAALALIVFAGVAVAAAQSGGTRFTGCVMTDMDGHLTFCEPDHCSLLSGEGVGAKLSGHTVTVEASVKEAGDGQPRQVVATRIVSVGAACNQSCALYSVHHRGIGGKDKPGSEGGTPGVTTKPQP